MAIASGGISKQHHCPSLPFQARRTVSGSVRSTSTNTRLRHLVETARSNSTPKSVNMATMASAARDIATTSSSSLGRDNLTAVAAARSVPVTTHPTNLPTPPNSISPNLPPVGLRAQLMRAGLEPSVDSDLDLHDRDAHDDEHSGPGSPPYTDSAGAITSAMLANCHLPEILLGQGPLPIRHIMAYLTTTVPGFAGIPPAKARRLVVAALEGKGSGGVGSGPDGDVEFIKVGWGRWHAKRMGQGSRAAAHDPPSRRTSPGGSSYPTSIPISKGGPGWHHLDRSRLAAMLGTSAGGASSAAFSHDDRLNEDRYMNMMDHEADKMSLDGSGSASCSEAPDDDDIQMDRDDPEDVTDDEDWAAVGAAALRASSYQAQTNHHTHLSPFNNVYSSSMRSFSGGMARPPQLNFKIPPSGLAGVMAADAQEREAVEALLQLGSV